MYSSDIFMWSSLENLWKIIILLIVDNSYLPQICERVLIWQYSQSESSLDWGGFLNRSRLWRQDAPDEFTHPIFFPFLDDFSIILSLSSIMTVTLKRLTLYSITCFTLHIFYLVLVCRNLVHLCYWSCLF